MNGLTDRQLLHVIAHGADAQRRAAMETLIHRELDFVYSAAVRQARFDRDLAQDITQAVFILLARKAPKLRHDVILRDWLFVTTRYAAKNALKIEARRKYHEQRAAMERSIESTSDHEALRDRLTPLIDEAVARLNSVDRAGVLLSFFDNKTYREVGATLGVSEEAARKRVNRAIDKMRAFFASRGVRVDGAAGTVVVSSALRANADSIPPALANSVLDVALSAHLGAATTTTSYLLAKGAGKMFMYAKLKLAAGAIAASVIVGGSGVALFAQAKSDKAAPAGAAAAAAPAAAESKSFVAKFDDGITVECLGITRLGDRQENWWLPDGSPGAHSCDPPNSTNQPPHTHQLLFRVTGAPDDAGIVYYYGPKLNWSSEEARQGGAPMEGVTMTFRADDRQTIDLTCMVAAGQWETALTADHLDGQTGGAGKHGGVIFSPTINAPNPYNNQQPGAQVTVSHDVSAYQTRVVGTDDNGAEHVARKGGGLTAASVRQFQFYFDMPVENLRSVSFQVRPYDHKATFANLTLDPAKKTNVSIKVEKD